MKIKLRVITVILLTGVMVVGAKLSPTMDAFALPGPSVEGKAAPEFTHGTSQDWINSPPLKLANLRGDVVMVDFWTFECWNCYRSIPWLNTLNERYAKQGFTMVSVHTPEFDRERVRSNIVRKVAEFNIKNPVMVDNDFSYWNAMGNRYWPSFYLIDKQGRVRSSFIGETHVGDRRALEIEGTIETLLAEKQH